MGGADTSVGGRFMTESEESGVNNTPKRERKRKRKRWMTYWAARIRGWDIWHRKERRKEIYAHSKRIGGWFRRRRNERRK